MQLGLRNGNGCAEPAILAGFSAIAFAVYLARRLVKQEVGDSCMLEIHDAIKVEAIAFLSRQYNTASVFIVVRRETGLCKMRGC